MTRLMALVLALGIAQPVTAQQTTLSSQDVRAASADFLAEGDNARAAAFADLILAVDPNDLDALILRSRAALGLGDFDTAKQLSKQAFRGTSNRTMKFLSARLAAFAHAEIREDTLAQLWLRRARQFSPDDANAEQVARDYRFLANRNPWSTSLQFGITPSSNVNNGSSEDTQFFSNLGGFGTLSLDARDLPGLEVFGGVGSSYRLSVNDTSATFLNFSGQFRTAVLYQGAIDDENEKERRRVESNAAAAAVRRDALLDQAELLPDGAERNAILEQAEALPEGAERDALLAQAATLPDGQERTLLLLEALRQDDAANAIFSPESASGSDFSSVVLSTGITHRRIFVNGWDPTTFRFDTGYVWYAGDPLSWNYGGSVSQTYDATDTLQLSFQAGANQRNVFERNNSDAYDVQRFDAQIGADYAFGNDDKVSFSFSAVNSVSSRANSDFIEMSINTNYAIGRPIAGMLLGFGFGYSEKDFGFDGISGQDRVDETISINGRARFTEIELYGFQPEITISGSKTDSVSERFETDTFRVGFDLRSSF